VTLWLLQCGVKAHIYRTVIPVEPELDQAWIDAPQAARVNLESKADTVWAT